MFSRRDFLTASAILAVPAGVAAQDAPTQDVPAPNKSTQNVPALTPPIPPKDDGIIRVPLQVTHNQPWIEVWLNGQGPYRFVLDTGDAAGYTIDQRLAESLHLPLAFGVNIAGVTGRAHRQAYQVKDVVIGGVLRDGGRVFTPSSFNGVNMGLLPAQLLRLLPCDLDFGDGELRLYERGRPSREGWERIGLRVLDSTPFQTPPSAFVIDVTLDGERYRMGIDTGDVEAITIFASTVERRNLWARYPKWLEGGSHGVVKSEREHLVRLKTLKMGSFELPNPVVHLVDPSEHDNFEDVNGLIGMETLRRFGLSFDAGDNALWLKPNGALHQPFRYNRSGLAFRTQNNRRVVMSVAAGSPAATAALQVGDILEKTGPDFAWRLQDGPGTVLDFEVERGGVRQPVQLILADLI